MHATITLSNWQGVTSYYAAILNAPEGYDTTLGHTRTKRKFSTEERARKWITLTLQDIARWQQTGQHDLLVFLS